MNKLTKKQIDERKRIQAELNDAEAEFEGARNKLNSVITEANTWAEEIANDIQEYIDDKSEKWQEGERGQVFSEWQTSYDEFALEEIDEPSLPGEDAFSGLEEEPNL